MDILIKGDFKTKRLTVAEFKDILKNTKEGSSYYEDVEILILTEEGKHIEIAKNENIGYIVKIGYKEGDFYYNTIETFSESLLKVIKRLDKNRLLGHTFNCDKCEQLRQVYFISGLCDGCETESFYADLRENDPLCCYCGMSNTYCECIYCESILQEEQDAAEWKEENSRYCFVCDNSENFCICDEDEETLADAKDDYCTDDNCECGDIPPF